MMHRFLAQTRHNRRAERRDGTDDGASRAREWIMVEQAKSFARDDSGAVSAEWVVLVAGVVMLCVAAFFSMESGTLDLAQGTSDHLTGTSD
jgi:Flp pilus assembly pilin Flp